MPQVPLIIVPARLNSTRLPNKPLAELAGKPMIVRVLERAQSAVSDKSRVIAAVDSVTLKDVVEDAGYVAVLTDPLLPSGTDRIAAAIKQMSIAENQIIVNLQGDEPLMPTNCLHQVIDLLLSDPSADWATLVTPASEIERADPNVVKAVLSDDGFALYFSRCPIPYQRDISGPSPATYRHIGLYAYRYGALKRMISTPPSPLEIAESLEQLRALSLGMRIKVGVTQFPPPHGVDTQQDLELTRTLFERSSDV